MYLIGNVIIITAFSCTCQPNRNDAYAHSINVLRKSWAFDGLNHNLNKDG